MKKFFLHILLVGVLGMLTVSCRDEYGTVSPDNSNMAQVVFSVAMDTPVSRTRAEGTDGTWGGDYNPSDPGDAYDNHIAIDQLIVKIVADGGTAEYEVTDIFKWKSDNEKNVYKFVGIVKGVDQSTTLTNPKVYVYANMGTTTPAETFSQKAANIPMWGVKSVSGNLTFTPGTRVDLEEISLLRAMAKLEVRLNDEMAKEYTLVGATLNKYNNTGYTYPTLPENFDGSTGDLNLEGVLNANDSEEAQNLALEPTEDGSSYIVYLPEVKNGTSETDWLKISVDLKEKNGTDTEEGSFFIKDYSDEDNPVAIDIIRNHWYKYTVTGFAASQIFVEYKALDWQGVGMEIGGDGFLFLSKDVIEIYNSNIDADQLTFSSSSPIVNIALKDIYRHERNGSFTEGKKTEEGYDGVDGVFAYYIDKFGVLTQLSDEEGKDEATVFANISATVKEENKKVLNGGIVINSPFMADKDASETALQSDSHYNTVRYLEFEVENEQGLLATFRVMQYPPVVVTNEEGYFSYRSDQKYSENQEEASHFHNYQGWKSIHLSGLMFYHVHDWTAGDKETVECCPTDTEKTDYKYADYSWVGTDCGKPGLAPCEVVHYGNIGAPHSFVDNRGVEVSYTYGGLYRSTVGTDSAFLRHRYYKLPGAQSTGIYKEQKLNGQIVGGYKISSRYYYHPQGDVQGLAIGRVYEENGRKYRKHYTWNVNPIFYNLYVDKVHQATTSDRKQGQADIHQMTHATTTYYGDKGTGWGSWGRTSYVNHRMYHVKTTVASSEYAIGVVELIDKEGKPTNNAVTGVAANSKRNANIISPSFMVASQLGETSYQSIVNSAAAYPKQYIVPDAGNFYKLAVDHCREYVETTYKDLNNNYQWDKGEPVTHYDDWRLPTQAEINKIIDLQNTSRAMDKLLVGQYYFCATGAGDDADTSVKENWVSKEVDGYTSGKTGYYIRCVRDVKPEGQNGFLEKQ